MQIDRVVGNSTDKRWSQVYSNTDLPNPLFISLEIEGAELLDLPMYGASFIESVEEKYSEGDPTLSALERVFTSSMSELVEGLTCSAVLCSVVSGVLYVVGKGDIRVELIRNGMSHSILTPGDEITSLSGKLEDDDVVTLGTKGFFDVTSTKLSEAALSDSLPSETLAPLVHARDDSSSVAGLLVSGPFDRGVPAPQEEARVESVGRPVGGLFSRLRSISLPSLRNRPIRVVRKGDSRRSSLLGLIVLSLLILSVVLGVWRRSAVLKENRYTELEQTVTQQMDEARAISDLNPERSRDLLSQSRDQIGAYINDTKDEEYRVRAQSLLSQVESTEQEALKKHDALASPYVDMGVFSSSFDPTDMYLSEEGVAYMWDTQTGEIYGLELNDKSSFRVGSSSDFPGVLSASWFDDTVFAYTDSGVVSHPTEGGEAEVVVESDEVFEDVTHLKMYAGNIYLVDTGSGEIWKYPVLDDGWGSRRRWFGAGIVLDLSNVTDVFIDGDIWLLTSSGKLERYSQGVPADFSMEGFPSLAGDSQFKDPTGVFVTEDNVYVLERGSSRVVVFSIDGNYVRQYVSPEFGSATDLVVHESQGYVISTKQLMRFPLE